MASVRAQPPSADAVSSLADGRRGESAYPPDNQGERGDSQSNAIAEQRLAVIKNVVRLRRRSEFLAVAATGRRWVAPAFVLQVGPRGPADDAVCGEIGLGFTATKRIGNAVARNRAKRRLREAARLSLPDVAEPGHDYVLVARTEVLTCAFQTLMVDLEKAFSRVLTVKPRTSGPPRGKNKPQRTQRPSPSAA